MARKRRCRQNGPREKAVLIRVDDDEKRMLQDAARRRGQTVSLTVIEAVKLLEGRPMPHGRRSLQTARAASQKTQLHTFSEARNKLGKWPEMLRAKAACVRSKRVAVRLYLMCDTDMIAYVIRSCRGWC